MPTVFTQIINGDIPGSFVWRDEKCVSFLSINPIRPGHCLVVPIREVDHWLDLETAEMQHLIKVGQHIGKALQEVYNPQRVGMMIAGFEVPHTHLHIMCIDNMEDMDLINAAANVDPEDFKIAAEQIQTSLSAKGHDSVSDS